MFVVLLVFELFRVEGEVIGEFCVFFVWCVVFLVDCFVECVVCLYILVMCLVFLFVVRVVGSGL